MLIALRSVHGTTHRHRIQRWLWRLFIFLLICGGTALVLPSAWQWAPLGLGGLLLLCFGPALVALYVRARRLDMGLSQVTANPWVHRQYTPEQWQAWSTTQMEWERSRNPAFSWQREGRSYLLTGTLLGLIFLFTCWLELHGNIAEKLAVAAVLMISVMLLIVSARWFDTRKCERRYRRLLSAPLETFFGDDGLFCNGEYSQWTFSGSQMKEVDAINNPPLRLVFLFETFNGNETKRIVRRTLIPEGRESDLEVLQQKLQVKCPTATIRLAIQPAVP